MREVSQSDLQGLRNFPLQKPHSTYSIDEADFNPDMLLSSTTYVQDFEVQTSRHGRCHDPDYPSGSSSIVRSLLQACVPKLTKRPPATGSSSP